MKGQAAIILMVLFLLMGILIFVFVSIIFVPIIKSIVATPVLESPVVGVITALLGYLPSQCSVLTTTECRFCLVTEKLLPLVINTVMGIILFSVLLAGFPGVGAIGRWKEASWKEGLGGGLTRHRAEFYGIVLLMSLALSIFMLHLDDPLKFLNWMTMIIAIIVRIVSFMVVDVPELRRVSDFFLAANILVNGWTNLWIIPIVFIGGLIFASTVEGGTPRIPFTGLGAIILIIVLLVLGVIVWAIFEFQIATPFGKPPVIEYHGFAKYLQENLNLQGKIECGKNTIGPESSISL